MSPTVNLYQVTNIILVRLLLISTETSFSIFATSTVIYVCKIVSTTTQARDYACRSRITETESLLASKSVGDGISSVPNRARRTLPRRTVFRGRVTVVTVVFLEWFYISTNTVKGRDNRGQRILSFRFRTGC